VDNAGQLYIAQTVFAEPDACIHTIFFRMCAKLFLTLGRVSLSVIAGSNATKIKLNVRIHLPAVLEERIKGDLALKTHIFLLLACSFTHPRQMPDNTLV